MYEKFEEELLKLLYGFVKPTHVKFIDQWVESLHRWERINFENTSIWIERLLNILEEENPSMDRYFVMVAGLILDIEPNLDEKLSILKKATPRTEKNLEKKLHSLMKNESSLKTYLLCVLQTQKRIKKIIKEFNNEEKSAIIFLRNKYSHPVLSNYKIKLVQPDEDAKFEFDTNKYITSGKNLKIQENELFDTTKVKLLKHSDELKNLQAHFWQMRNGEYPLIT